MLWIFTMLLTNETDGVQSEKVICFLPRHFSITGFRAVTPSNRDLFASGHNRTWGYTRHHTIRNSHRPSPTRKEHLCTCAHLPVQPAVDSKCTNKQLSLLQPSGSLRSAAWWEPRGKASGMCWHCWRHTWGHHTFSCLTHTYLEDWGRGGWEGGTFTGVGRVVGGQWPTTSQGFCSIFR